MASVPVHPVELSGPWDEGYALDRHTISSEFLGHDPFGNPMFDTKRSELGELVFRLKNRGDRAAIEPIADTVAQFIEERELEFDVIVPVPPSRERAVLPTVEVARAVAQRVDKPMREQYVRKVKATPELKNVYDYSERAKLLKDAFEVNAGRVKGKRILLLDDLYRSGATLKAIARPLRQAEPERVIVVALTKTRTRV